MDDKRGHQFKPEDDVQGPAYSAPHFVGFNNQTFDRHPTGDAILFKNSSAQFEIHIRNQKVSFHSNSSPAVIKAIAIRVGDEIIQYAVDRTFQIDGKPHKLDGIGIATPKTRT
ncbi:unnamed protein product, partial [Adineta ricciae]